MVVEESVLFVFFFFSSSFVDIFVATCKGALFEQVVVPLSFHFE